MRTAVERRWSPTCPSACCCPAASTPPGRRAARRGRPAGLNTFSIGFEAVGGEEGDEFKYSDVIAREFDTDHHQIRIDTERMLPALDRRRARDERADGQPRRVASTC
jgi:asparagine synthase (glutamine-hydrolysing)